MDDIREQMDLANEISDAISQPLNFGAEMDEDELNQELELLEQEQLDSQLLDTGLDLPSVPTNIPGNYPYSCRFIFTTCRFIFTDYDHVETYHFFTQVVLPRIQRVVIFISNMNI